MKRLCKKKPKYLIGPICPNELIELIKEKLPYATNVKTADAFDTETEFSYINDKGRYKIVIFSMEHIAGYGANIYDAFPKNLRIVYGVSRKTFWNNYGAKELTKKLRKI